MNPASNPASDADSNPASEIGSDPDTRSAPDSDAGTTPANEPGAAPGAGRSRRPGLRGMRSLARAMALGFARDRTATFFTLIFPMLFLLLFGALEKNPSIGHSKVLQVGAVSLFDGMDRQARAQLAQSVTLIRDDDLSDALRKVRDGTDDALVEETSRGTLVLRFSAADQVRSATVQGVLNGIVQQANQAAATAATGRPPAFALRSQQVEDRSLKPIQFLTPGLLGWAIASSATFSAALTLVSWRKKRILRRLRLAPIGLGSVITAPVLVTLVIAVIQTAVFLAVATTPYYGLKLTGDWWIGIPLILCGSLAFMAIGLLAGSRARTEQAASSISQVVVLPMAFLSGSFFSLDSAPGWLRDTSQVMPLRHLSTALESVLSRGGGWGDALPTMGGLLLFAAVLTAIAARLFRWDDT